ncbi:MAG: DUF1211 domain-containing protein [Cyclobacteriaceae bacterium]
MIRSKLKEGNIGNTHGQFRFRGTTNTRIEALSDGVFAIATALLIISSSIPETFDQLLVFLDDLVPFAICITMLILIWFQHYLFFIRYGFKDAKIVAINTLLLFLILFYVYPLKFLFKVLYEMFPALFSGNQEKLNYLFIEVMPIADAPTLMVIYGIGAMGIFLTLTLMYWMAYKRRASLDLNEIEIFDTIASMRSNLLMGLIPAISVLVSLFRIFGSLSFTISGMIYMSYAFIMPTFGIFAERKRNKILQNETEPDNQTTE